MLPSSEATWLIAQSLSVSSPRIATFNPLYLHQVVFFKMLAMTGKEMPRWRNSFFLFVRIEDAVLETCLANLGHHSV